jgi:hypothetical protein
MPVRGRPRLVSSQPNTTKLFVDDRREVIALSSNEKKTVSDVIRELVHEALRTRRLRSIGRDEGDHLVRRIHQETIAEGINPVVAELANLRQTIETTSASYKTDDRSSGNSPSTTEQAILALLSQVLNRVTITENITKVLMTVGMQKDKVGAEEITVQLSNHDENGLRQAQQITQKILLEHRLLKPAAVGK